MVQLKKEFLRVEMDVRDSISPDEIIWENLRSKVNPYAGVKLFLIFLNVATIIFSAFFIMLIEKGRIQEG